ncbi:unnamed protein product [Leptosia nina]|uniref:Glucose-1-phosphatase n=1 Tax=Leptosia nina TaxID=320188 RepID=A0AAV1JEN0_9NEOP
MAGKSTLLLVLCLLLSAAAKDRDLKQVLILSRHNIRAPLSSNLRYLSNKTWPTWEVEPGFLTAKGALLERQIGNYISNWLIGNGLLPAGCPDQNDIHVYANTKQRTRKTAKAFVDGAFQNCNITVYSKNSTKMDPIFNPIIRNSSLDLKLAILSEMERSLNSLNLRNAYAKLNDIVDLEHADICRIEGVCDFQTAREDLVYDIDDEPNVRGPLSFTNSIVDAFLMSYYEGMQIDDVAWGHINSPEDWKLFTPIIRGNLDVRFNGTILSKEVAKPLLNYVYNILKDDSKKFTLLVGHDSNLYSVMAAIGIKPYNLPEQYELTPIGGKIVFQKWHDARTGKSLLKIEYIYQSTSQLRNGEMLTESNLPKRVTLAVKNCDVDNEGLCPWDEFLEILKHTFE